MPVLYVTNAGQQPAINVHFDPHERSYWKDSRFWERFASLRIFSTGIAYLAPGRDLRYPFGSFVDWERVKAGENEIEFTVSFESEQGHSFTANFTIDLLQFDNLTLPIYRDPVREMVGLLRNMNYRQEQDFLAKQSPIPFERRKKRCEYCKEEIADEAIKCRFCGEFVEGDAPRRGLLQKLQSFWKGK